MADGRSMRLSVIVPWCDRPVLADTLARNAEFLNEPGIETLIVNGGGDAAELERITSKSGWPGLQTLHSPRVTFNKPSCLNLGAARARAPYLFVLDADVILTRGFLPRALQTVSSVPPCFASVATVLESEPGLSPRRWNPDSAITRKVFSTRLTASSGKTATVEYRWTRDGTRTGPGLVAVARKDFIAVQGFNSALTDWGFEDYDFQIRLQLLLGLKRRSFGKALHLSHEGAPRRGEDSRNEQVCFRNYEQGKFLGTFDSDVARGT
ncbi:MAG: galactosyltransferase-related protein [Acidobacteriota bacterium]